MKSSTIYVNLAVLALPIALAGCATTTGDDDDTADAALSVDAEAVPDVAVPPDVAATPDARVRPDAERKPDADTALDAGVLPDAGVRPDADMTPDAGLLPDAGVRPDADMSLDAGLLPDAGARPDANMTPDAGILPDAGVRPDADVTPDASGPIDPVINEFVADHYSLDRYEYFEIYGSPDADYSAYTILAIEGEFFAAGTDRGVIDSAFAVGLTDSGGFYLTPFTADAVENSTATFLLVEGFSGRVGDDVDPADTGEITNVLWTRIVDAVGVRAEGASELNYPGAHGVVLQQYFDGSRFTVGGASRRGDGVDTNTVGDWVRNHFFGEGLPVPSDSDPFADPGEGINTPGAPNQIKGE